MTTHNEWARIIRDTMLQHCGTLPEWADGFIYDLAHTFSTVRVVELEPPPTMTVNVNGVPKLRRIVEFRTNLGEGLNFRMPIPVPETFEGEMLYWIVNGDCYIVSGKKD